MTNFKFKRSQVTSQKQIKHKKIDEAINDNRQSQLPEEFNRIYKDIIDFLPHGIVFIDMDEKVVFKNASLLSILSIT